MYTKTFPLATLLLILGTNMLACSDAAAPGDRPSPENAAPLHAIQVNGPEDIPFDDGESLPPEFNAAPLIQSKSLDADFTKDYAYATASMRFFATHGKIELSMLMKRGTAIVDSGSSIAVDENLLPAFRTIVAPLTISNPGPCGHRIDAQALFSAWMAFPLPKSAALFSWGLTVGSLGKPAAQAECPPPPPPPPSWGGEEDEWDGDWDSWWDSPESEDAYSGTCGLYQLWIATVNGVIVDWWWERTDVDDSYCNSLFPVY